jgi:hypothetical protein
MDILDDATEKRKAPFEFMGQITYLRKVHVTGHQRQQHRVLPGAIAQIDVAELSGIVHFVIRDDVEPLDCLLEELHDVVDRLGMDWTGRDVHHLVGLWYVETDAHLTFYSPNRQLHPGAIAELRRRSQRERNRKRAQGRIRSQRVHHNLAFFL